MKPVPGNGVWHLVDEAAPPDANLIAVLRGPIEILAVKARCEQMLRSEGVVAEFGFIHNGRSYHVTPHSDRGDRLSLRIVGTDGSQSRVETEFTWPASG